MNKQSRIVSSKEEDSDMSQTSISEHSCESFSDNISHTEESSEVSLEEQVDQEEEKEFQWKEYNRQHKLDLKLPNFTLKPGIQYQVHPSVATPLYYFQLFVDDEMFQEICKNTELFYTQKKDKKRRFSNKKK